MKLWPGANRFGENSAKGRACPARRSSAGVPHTGLPATPGRSPVLVRAKSELYLVYQSLRQLWPGMQQQASGMGRHGSGFGAHRYNLFHGGQAIFMLNCCTENHG